jgi:hypothetical protein
MRASVQATTLPDKRLEARYAHIVEQLHKAPGRSLPNLFEGWAETKAAYRFFANERVSYKALIAGQRQATEERLTRQECKQVLYLQDSTAFSFQHHPTTEGMGPIGGDGGSGFFAHTTLAASPQGVPQGLIAQHAWARDADASDQDKPFEARESAKWVVNLAAGVPWQVIHVCDREADSYDVMDHMLAHGHDFLIRARHNRHLLACEHRLMDEVANQEVQTYLEVELPDSHTRASRTARLAVRFCPVQLPAPQDSAASSVALALTCLDIREVDPPEDVDDPVHWVLLTSCELETVEQAVTLVRYYTYRWLIERFHYVLKSGCRIEDRQLGSQSRLQRLLAVFNQVAWRLLWFTYQARQTPDAACTVAFSSREWQVLYRYQYPDAPFPSRPPTLRQAQRWVAQLGGFLARRGDGDPGVKVLWRGWQRLQDFVTASHLAL